MRLGVDLGGTKIEIVAIDGSGGERFRHRVATPQGDYEATLDAIATLVRETERSLGVAQGSCTIGVGTPGSLSAATGLLRNSNSVCLNGHPFKRDLEARVAREIRMSNDANCFAVSEAQDGAAAGAHVVLGVILGTGVGGGIVVDGVPLDGHNGIAGEWGHNPLPWPRDDERPGAACYCGREGCIETFVSGPAFERDHLARTGRDTSRIAWYECLAHWKAAVFLENMWKRFLAGDRDDDFARAMEAGVPAKLAAAEAAAARDDAAR